MSWSTYRQAPGVRLWAWLSRAALASAVLAVPVVLYVLGGSPFHQMGLADAGKTLAGARRAGGIQPAVHWLAWGAMLFAWISWAWMTVCVALELGSWMTGNTPARLPASRTMQSLAACLVGTALAVSAVSRYSPTTRRLPSASTLTAAPPGIAPGQAITSLGQLRVLDDP
ncbi:MAG: hypothetical protein ACRDYE_11720, partial [Acidimicrobiales bacterium]